jgi:cytochrome P450
MLIYDPLAPPDWQDPYPIYRRLRDEYPVYHAERMGTWCISRHADVSAILRDTKTFSSASAFEVLMRDRLRNIGLRDAFEIGRFLYRSRLNPLTARKSLPPSIITSDPPQHDELRAIVSRGFTPARMRIWELRVREIVSACMEKLHRGEPFDVVRDLAVPLPVTIIADMIGIEPERRADFKRWSDDLIAGSSGSQRAAVFTRFLQAMGEIIVYMRQLADARRRDPRDDLISALVDPRHGEVLDDGKLGQFVIVLLVGGNETTTNLITNTVSALLKHPEVIERVIAEPELMSGLIEEGLRYDSPLQLLFRRATRECEIAGTRIPENANVTLLLGSANRDERQFDAPDRFDPTRTTKGHLGFGLGVHFCLGSALARIETRIVLEALLPALVGIRHESAASTFIDSFMVRGRDRLVVQRPAV